MSTAAINLPSNFGSKCVDFSTTLVAKVSPKKLDTVLAGFVAPAESNVTTKAEYVRRWWQGGIADGTFRIKCAATNSERHERMGGSHRCSIYPN